MSSLAHSSPDGASIPTEDVFDIAGEWTEAQFDALITLHMLKPGHVLTEDECWAIEYTRRQADVVENSAVDAFDNGRKHGIQSIAGKSDMLMFEELERLKTELAVQKALVRYYHSVAFPPDTTECAHCGGSGKIVEEARYSGQNVHSACQRDCDECDGTGSVAALGASAGEKQDGYEAEGGVNTK